MGRAMAHNLAAAGLTVRAWNRSREKAEPLAADGVEICDTPEEAATGATIVLTMLADGDSVLDAAPAALAAELGTGAAWVQMSTIGEAATERCAKLAEQHGVGFVDAPVLGTKQPAEEGKLVVLASGPESLRDRLAPVFDAVGQRTMWVGEAGAGSQLKLATNGWLVTIVEGAAESLAFLEGVGLDPSLLLEAVGGGPLDLPYLQLKGKAMLAREFEPSFTLKLAAKDAALVEAAAEAHGLDLPLVRTVRERFAAGAEEHGDLDLSATFLSSAPRN
jgi:3-hydroxyisobutyrate dehydrogenase